MPTFKVQGQVNHTYGLLLPKEGENPQFLQIYFMADPDTELELRSNVVPDLRLPIVHDLQDFSAWI